MREPSSDGQPSSFISVAQHRDPFIHDQLQAHRTIPSLDCSAPHNAFFDLELPFLGDDYQSLMNMPFADVANASPLRPAPNSKEMMPHDMVLFHDRLTMGEEDVGNRPTATPGTDSVGIPTQHGDILSQGGGRGASVLEPLNRQQNVYSVDVSDDEGEHL